MPLIILGLIVLILMLIYAIAVYRQNGSADARPVRERYAEAFAKRAKDVMEKTGVMNSDEEKSGEGDSGDEDEPIHARAHVDTDDLRGDLEHLARNIKESALDLVTRTIEKYANGSGNDDEDKTIIFPTDNVEAEKKKRNINSD